MLPSQAQVFDRRWLLGSIAAAHRVFKLRWLRHPMSSSSGRSAMLQTAAASEAICPALLLAAIPAGQQWRSPSGGLTKVEAANCAR